MRWNHAAQRRYRIAVILCARGHATLCRSAAWNRYALSATPVDRPVTGLARLLGVKRHEWPALIVAFIYFFCVLAAYFLIRPVRDQFPAAIGSKELPFFYGVVFVVMLLLTPLYGKLVARYPRRWFVPAVYALSALISLIWKFVAVSFVSGAN